MSKKCIAENFLARKLQVKKSHTFPGGVKPLLGLIAAYIHGI